MTRALWSESSGVRSIAIGTTCRARVAGCCEPVLVETLTIADAKSYEDVENEIRATYPWVPVPDDIWSIVTAVRRDLAAKSQHQGLSVADHLVIATAIRLKLVVLHVDADFEIVARVVSQLRQERLTVAL